MKSRLVILNGESAGEKIEITRGQALIIGRDSNSDITLPERKISRQHSKVQWHEDTNEITIQDLESLNGTFVNSKQIREVTVLRDQDQIRVGSFLLRAEMSEEFSKPDSDEDDADHDISLVELGADLDDLNSSREEAAALDEINLESDMSDHKKASQAFEQLSSLNGDEELDEETADPLNETGGRLIYGKLSELSLPDVMQMLATTRKTGVLVISPEHIVKPPKVDDTTEACIFIEEGVVAAVTFENLKAEDAFMKILQIQSGYFALFPMPDVELTDRVDMPVEMMLLDGLRKLDEMKANDSELQDEDVLEAQPNESLTGLSAEELQSFQLAWKHKTVAKVVEVSSLDRDQLIKILQKLIKNGYLKKA